MSDFDQSDTLCSRSPNNLFLISIGQLSWMKYPLKNTTTLPSISMDKKWYVAYTFPRAEKKVQLKLQTMGIETFLPMHRCLRQWSDRKKYLTTPLFPNYVFVRVSVKDRTDTFCVKEIVRYVSFEGRAAVVNDEVINSLKIILSKNEEVDLVSSFRAGDRVRIIRGPLQGIEGTVIRKEGKVRILIQIVALQRAVAVNIACDDLVSSLDSFSRHLSDTVHY